MSTLTAHQNFLIKRTSEDETYMGHSLMKYAITNNLKIDDIKEELGCSDDNFVKLVLCRRISFGEPNFQHNVQQIAAYVGIDVSKLALFLKRISMTSVFMQVNRSETPNSSHFTIEAPFNYVAAARENEKDSSTKSPADDQ